MRVSSFYPSFLRCGLCPSGPLFVLLAAVAGTGAISCSVSRLHPCLLPLPSRAPPFPLRTPPRAARSDTTRLFFATPVVTGGGYAPPAPAAAAMARRSAGFRSSRSRERWDQKLRRPPTEQPNAPTGGVGRRGEEVDHPVGPDGAAP